MILDEKPKAGDLGKKVWLGPSDIDGVGVFLKPGEKLSKGEIIIEFPGKPFWVPKDEAEKLGDKSEYVFTLNVDVRVGNKTYIIAWDALEMRTWKSARRCAHLLNSSHPLLHGWLSKPNCVFAVYAAHLKFDVTQPPNVKMYIMCGVKMRASLSPVELLVDYHWLLASKYGFWCLRKSCRLCCDGLRYFVNSQLS